MSNTSGKKDLWSKRIHEKIEQVTEQPMERRSFLKGALLGGLAATMPVTTAKAFDFQKFFQKHYKEMSDEDKRKVFERISRETNKDYGAKVRVGDARPLPGVKFAFALSLSKCNGNRACVHACVKENNLSRDPEIQYIKVLEMPVGSLNLEKGDMYYSGGKVPKDGKYYLPVQCNQCDNPPCVKVCPVEATWKESDGIVVVDYDWCIGCRYCQTACPYEARHFNFSTPKIPTSEINPNQSYLSNRIRPKGVMEKCTFCLHRTRRGENPACLEACPTGARKFGNILDPNSDVAKIVREKRVFVLKEDLNTIPSFYYYFE